MLLFIELLFFCRSNKFTIACLSMFLLIVYDICQQSYIMLIFQIIADDDLIALVSDELFQPLVVWKLEDVQVYLYLCPSCLGQPWIIKFSFVLSRG